MLIPWRVRSRRLMAEICPGDLNGFLFPSGGGEANEAAIRMARLYTGKQKIFTQYRSDLEMSGDSLELSFNFIELYVFFSRGWGGIVKHQVVCLEIFFG